MGWGGEGASNYIYIYIYIVDTNNVIVYVKTEHTYVDLEKDVEMFDTWNYEAEGPLPTGEKSVIRLMKSN